MADMGDKLVTGMIALIVVSVLGGALVPTALNYLTNLSSIGGIASTLFATGGIIAILVIIGIFKGIMKLVKFDKR